MIHRSPLTTPRNILACREILFSVMGVPNITGSKYYFTCESMCILVVYLRSPNALARLFGQLPEKIGVGEGEVKVLIVKTLPRVRK